MSTQTQSRDDTKQQEAEEQIRSSKDDVKQQSALKKKESKKQQQIQKEDLPVDSGSSLVGGTLAAMQHAVDAGMNMLPVSVQKEASRAAGAITESYTNDGLIAAAKTAGGIGAGAVSAQATGLKDRIMPSSASKSKASDSGIKSTDDKKKALASGSEAADADPVEAPKKRTRRRRGGRGHGKIKMRTLPPRSEESIVDTLGDKARELKEVVIEAPVKKTNTNSNPGMIASARNTASQLMTNATNAASGIMSSASSAASGMVSGAQQQIENFKGNNKKEEASKEEKEVSKKEVSKKESSNSKASKPALERHDALPALGTPMTPADGAQKDASAASKPKLSAAPSDQSTLLEKASFLVGQARDYVADKLDDISMNADDSEPLEEEGAQDSVMDKAKVKLEEMADSVSAKVEQATSSSKKQTKQPKKQPNKPQAEEKEVETFQPKEQIN